MEFKFHVEGGDFTSAGTASSQIKKVLKQINIDPIIIKRVVVALYEAEVNIVAHAHHGDIKVKITPQQVYIRLDDEGPGIENVEKAMQKGFSTASSKVREMGFGAGMGLPNIKENADIFTVRSEVGKGTTLEITISTVNNG
ncbi:MAG: ATP-binding protein [Prevotellaceae bacterium]|jgi:anti-sigma regulatory factor (Ser/Thr protein kinase)|nr:ATP-binding protein [Prevotellaceae bacterium]